MSVVCKDLIPDIIGPGTGSGRDLCGIFVRGRRRVEVFAERVPQLTAGGFPCDDKLLSLLVVGKVPGSRRLCDVCRFLLRVGVDIYGILCDPALRVGLHIPASGCIGIVLRLFADRRNLLLLQLQRVPLPAVQGHDHIVFLFIIPCAVFHSEGDAVTDLRDDDYGAIMVSDIVIARHIAAVSILDHGTGQNDPSTLYRHSDRAEAVA